MADASLAVLLSFGVLVIGAIVFAVILYVVVAKYIKHKDESEQYVNAAKTKHDKVVLACAHSDNGRYRYLISKTNSILGKIEGISVVCFPDIGEYMDREDTPDGLPLKKRIPRWTSRRKASAFRVTKQYSWMYNLPILKLVTGRFKKYDVYLLFPDQVGDLIGGDVHIIKGYQTEVVGSYFFVVDEDFSETEAQLKVHTLTLSEAIAAQQEMYISVVQRAIKCDPDHGKAVQLLQDVPKAGVAMPSQPVR